MWGPDRVGVRLSPSGTFNDMKDSDPLATFGYVVRESDRLGIAFLHLIEGGAADIRHGGSLVPTERLRPLFRRALIVNGGYDRLRADVVLGAGGAVGSELVKTLSAAGARFRAAYNSPGKVDQARRDGLDAVAIDYAKPEAEISVVRAAKKEGVKHVVKLSVWGADGEAFSFAKVHRPVEREIEASGLGWTFLRPNGFMQNLPNFFAATIRFQGAFYMPSRGCRISHVDVRDIAAVASRALTDPGHEGKIYMLSGPEALTYTENAAKLSAAIGRPVTYVDVPDADFKTGAMAAGMPEAYADAMLSLIHYYEGDNASRVTQDVERVAGCKPFS